MSDWGFPAVDRSAIEQLRIREMEIRKGDRVRLAPSKGGDIMDIALAGKTAVIESIEQDYEGRFHIAVVLDDDPGKDLGLRRHPAHRFFFAPEEIEPLS